MSSRNVDDLVPEFSQKAKSLITNCKNRGYGMRPFATLRSPFEQAKLWRQSRSREEIQDRINEYKHKGATFLAYCLESVGPQEGRRVTSVGPGFSWHQWGEAMDCFWLVDRKAEWSTRKKINGLNGYHVYAEEAVALGLTAGGNWSSFKDWPHIQLRAASNPGRVLTIEEIDREMEARFSGDQI